MNGLTAILVLALGALSLNAQTFQQTAAALDKKAAVTPSFLKHAVRDAAENLRKRHSGK